MTSTHLEPIDDERLELGEGGRWTDEGFVCVDLLAGRLLRVSEAGLEEILKLDVPLGAVAPKAGGGWIAAAGTGIALLEDGDVTWIARPEAHAPVAMRMNDGATDPHGRFWAGSMTYSGDTGAGSLYRVDPDLTVTRVLSGLDVPNGPAFNRAGDLMYLADSARGLIFRYDVDPSTGDPGKQVVFARVDDASPDGMTVDAEDHLWCAMWGASSIHRYRPNGSLERVVDVPASQPTSVALTSEPPFRLLVTTATYGLKKSDRHDGRVLSAPSEGAGLPTTTFGGRSGSSPVT
jgi:sugar lactone lactonase YvrE